MRVLFGLILVVLIALVVAYFATDSFGIYDPLSTPNPSSSCWPECL